MSERISETEFQQRAELAILDLDRAFGDLAEEHDVDVQVQGGVVTRRILKTPVGIAVRKVERALSALNKLRKLNGEDGFESRVRVTSKMFLDRPYSENPLGGGP